MQKRKLDLETLGVETFETSPQLEAAFVPISRHSCIEQCTTSCTI